ncbi:hypothetical protein GCM10010124_13630 [Pilimelia terevasa]|uniref:Uncharacterized protein n=1 Tax=Pilimelia terevasa TaxID=53372 RepID=A0A8J3BHX6_9ACTN|nr:PD40 domain-containing protein [Pilimelia terevasa]GGK22410.1 hypothetical protein GCM10010124_13630 [Pilimelia terevasa]
MVGALRGGSGAVLTAAAVAAGLLGAPAPARAAMPVFDKLVAYVRDGDVWVSRGPTERRVTTGGGHRRPRWSPDHTRLVVLRGDQVYVMKADGTARTRVTARPVGGAAWAPDGRSLALVSAACLGGPGVYRAPATGGALTALFPAACRDREIPPAPAPEAAGGSLTARLRHDDGVAWSPDGARIAFRGGDCEAVLDDCLTLGNVATGGERLVAGYGGGGSALTGFAVVPSFRPDGAALTYSAYAEGPTAAQDQPLHVEEQDLATGATRTRGEPLDRESTYVDGTRLLATTQYRSSSWIVLLAPAGRTLVRKGSQPAY